MARTAAPPIVRMRPTREPSRLGKLITEIRATPPIVRDAQGELIVSLPIAAAIVTGAMAAGGVVTELVISAVLWGASI